MHGRTARNRRIDVTAPERLSNQRINQRHLARRMSGVIGTDGERGPDRPTNRDVIDHDVRCVVARPDPKGLVWNIAHPYPNVLHHHIMGIYDDSGATYENAGGR